MQRNTYFYCLIFLFIVNNTNGQNSMFFENFKSCNLAPGWAFAKQKGNFNFNLAKYSTDNTCAAVYNQSSNTDNSERNFSLVTDSYQSFNTSKHLVKFSLRFVKLSNNKLTVYAYLDDVKTKIKEFTSSVSTTGGTLLPQIIEFPTNPNVNFIKLEFEYSSLSADRGADIGIDNIECSGPDNDNCSRALAITIDGPCVRGNNFFAEFAGNSCTSDLIRSLWYSFTIDKSGIYNISNSADYNDVFTLYKGTCNQSPGQLICSNNDEYGFKGEQMYIDSAGTYYLMIAQKNNTYGRDSGSHCISIQTVKSKFQEPLNDICANAIPIIINATCTKHQTIYANTDGPIPSLNIKSRSNIWYQFTANASSSLEIISHANFSEVITVYEGTCSNMKEIKCADLGTKLYFNTIKNNQYFIQISGYFSTIEGNLCLELKDNTLAAPTNETCPTAKAIPLNTNCEVINFSNVGLSTKKPSCVVYNSSDIWYSFVAPAEKSIALHINASFLYDFAVYSGSCSTLVEVHCGLLYDPCKGFLTLDGLVAAKTYYLQILSRNVPIPIQEGSICVRIDDLSKATPFTPLEIQTMTDCLHGVLGRLTYSATGGDGNYNFTGPDQNSLLLPGEKYTVFVEDGNACRDFEDVFIACKPPSKCKQSNLDIQVSQECVVDNIGRQTGEVILHVTANGGTGAYYFYGTQDLSKLKDGDEYQAIVIDSDSCYVIQSGKIYCRKFDCSQSKLNVQVQYDCVDTLLKAVLKTQVTGNLGTITYLGNKDGDVLEQGSEYNVIVMDEAGCTVNQSAKINCKFDSCAYSRITLTAAYECLLDQNNNRTGKAILSVKGTSYAGGLVYSGNKDGEILNHKDTYHVVLSDSFGCSQELKGEISCSPTVAVDNQGIKDFFSIAPNPGKELLHILLSEGTVDDAKIHLLTIDGKVLNNVQKSFQNERNIITLHTQNVPTGTYIISIQTEKGKFSRIWVRI